MDTHATSLRDRILMFLSTDAKFNTLRVSDRQIDNVEHRILEVRTPHELDALTQGDVGRLVRMVWPLARYVDRE
jgi:hypothetical protein